MMIPEFKTPAEKKNYKYVRKVFSIIEAKAFIEAYTTMTYNSTFKHKLRGFDGNKQPKTFNDDEVAEIRKGLKLAFTEILKP